MPIFNPPPAWVEAAICAQTDPEAFFPEKGESADPARRICAVCPVQRDCLEDALPDADRRGVWGGTSEIQRRRLRTERRRAAAASPRASTADQP
jgi:WhiB family transcriptional regulator, redox-sensing transcriptional regulator